MRHAVVPDPLPSGVVARLLPPVAVGWLGCLPRAAGCGGRGARPLGSVFRSLAGGPRWLAGVAFCFRPVAACPRRCQTPGWAVAIPGWAGSARGPAGPGAVLPRCRFPGAAGRGASSRSSPVLAARWGGPLLACARLAFRLGPWWRIPRSPGCQTGLAPPGRPISVPTARGWGCFPRDPRPVFPGTRGRLPQNGPKSSRFTKIFRSVSAREHCTFSI